MFFDKEQRVQLLCKCLIVILYQFKTVVESATLSKTVKDISAFRAAFSAHSCMYLQNQVAHADYPNKLLVNIN